MSTITTIVIAALLLFATVNTGWGFVAIYMSMMNRKWLHFRTVDFFLVLLLLPFAAAFVVITPLKFMQVLWFADVHGLYPACFFGSILLIIPAHRITSRLWQEYIQKQEKNYQFILALGTQLPDGIKDIRRKSYADSVKYMARNHGGWQVQAMLSSLRSQYEGQPSE